MNHNYLNIAISAAKTSGKILIDYFQRLNDQKQKNKNIRDLVTEVDILSETNIKKMIRKEFPTHSIIAEESGIDKKNSSCIWYIDPIDGTVNYSQGIPICAISIAFEENNKLAIGVIYNPFSDELYYASEGNGSYLNGNRINVSIKSEMKNGLYIAAFSSSTAKEKIKEYEIFGIINDSSRGVLRIGSAAMAMAYLAEGKVDGFWAKNLWAWDIAAGVILVNEANGKVTNFNGDDYNFRNKTILASNNLVHSQLLKYFSKI